MYSLVSPIKNYYNNDREISAVHESHSHYINEILQGVPKLLQQPVDM